MANEAKRQQPANPELQTQAAEIFRQLSTAVASSRYKTAIQLPARQPSSSRAL